MKYAMRYFLVGLLALFGQESLYAQTSTSSCYAHAGVDSTICFSQNSVVLNGVAKRKVFSTWSDVSATWSGGNGTFVSGTGSKTNIYIPTQSEVDAGFVKLILRNTSGSCSIRDTVTITIQRVTENTITGPATICAYSSGNTYSVPALSGVAYDWHVVGGTVTSGGSSNSVNVSWGAAGPGYIYLVLTDNLGCVGVSSTAPVSRYHFNTSDLDEATIGPDAVSYDNDAEGNGSGFTITNNCGGSKGIDLEIPGSVMDRGKLCMTFSWQRDESEAGFFKRGGTEFYINGGQLRIKLTQYSGSGSTVVGPINTGYTVPNDDVFRYFTFCYDSASGIARVLVNDSIVWNYQTGSSTSLYWVGSGNAEVGTTMDGACAGKTLLDWANISIPVSIYLPPTTTLSGEDTLCLNQQFLYDTDTPSTTSYTWTANGGTIVSGQSGPAITVKWTQSGNRSIGLEMVNTQTGCGSSMIYNVKVNSLPEPVLTGNDSLCAGAQQVYTASGSGLTYQWSNSYSGLTSTTSSLNMTWAAAGNYKVYVRSLNTATTCVDTDTVPVWVKAYPVPQISGPSILCLDQADDFQVVNVTGMTYAWTSGDNAISSGQGTQEVSVIHPAAGNKTLSILVTDPVFGCATTTNKNYVVMPKPLTDGIYHY